MVRILGINFGKKKTSSSSVPNGVITKSNTPSYSVPSGNIQTAIKSAGITTQEQGRFTKPTTSSSGGSARDIIPTGNIQETLRQEGITTQEQGRVTKPKVITQQQLRNITLSSGQIATIKTSPYDQGSINVQRVSPAVDSSSLLRSPDFKTFSERLNNPPNAKSSKADKWVRENLPRGNELPFGLQPTTTQQAQEKFNVFYAGDYIGARVSEALPKTTEKVNQLFNSSTMAQNVLNVGYGVTRELPKWVFFSPAMEVGASATKQKTITEKLSESDKLSAFRKLSKVEKDLASKKNAKEQIKYLSKIYKDLKTPEAKANFKEYVQELYEKEIFRGVPIDYIQKNPPSITGNTIQASEVEFIQNLPRMKNVGQVSSISSDKNLFIQKEVQVNQPSSNIDLSQNKINQLSLDNKQTTTQKEKQNIFFRSSSKTKQSPKQDQIVIQESKTDQSTKQNQPEKQKVMTLLKTTSQQKQDSILNQLLRLSTTTAQKTTQKPKEKPFRLLKGFSSSEQKSYSKEPSFQVFGKRFGKDFSLGFSKSKEGAEKKLSKFLTGTLARSGKITKNGEELLFESLNLGEMFRPSKKDKTRIVQKAKYSLGSRGETSEIQFFRKKGSKSKNLFGI